METTITTTLFRPFETETRFVEDREVNRYRALNFRCVAPVSDETAILEWLFAATNAPNELLDAEQAWIVGVFYNAHEYSISVGDVLQVNDCFYLCKNCGWEKLENFIETYEAD